MARAATQNVAPGAAHNRPSPPIRGPGPRVADQGWGMGSTRTDEPGSDRSSVCHSAAGWHRHPAEPPNWSTLVAGPTPAEPRIGSLREFPICPSNRGVRFGSLPGLPRRSRLARRPRRGPIRSRLVTGPTLAEPRIRSLREFSIYPSNRRAGFGSPPGVSLISRAVLPSSRASNRARLMSVPEPAEPRIGSLLGVSSCPSNRGARRGSPPRSPLRRGPTPPNSRAPNRSRRVVGPEPAEPRIGSLLRVSSCPFNRDARCGLPLRSPLRRGPARPSRRAPDRSRPVAGPEPAEPHIGSLREFPICPSSAGARCESPPRLPLRSRPARKSSHAPN